MSAFPVEWIRAVGALAGLYGFVAVALGAFAAHAAEGRLAAENLEWLETGARYQLVHALAMVALAALPSVSAGPARVAAVAFGAGVALFSGSLYALAFGAPRFLGAVTPVGGVLLLVGWAALAFSAYRAF